MMSRAFGDRLWLSTKSARSRTRGAAPPASIFSMIGRPLSGSVCITPLSARSFSSSSFCRSAEMGCPAACRISSSSALASFTHGLVANCFAISLIVSSASLLSASLDWLYAFQYIAASARPFVWPMTCSSSLRARSNSLFSIALRACS